MPMVIVSAHCPAVPEVNDPAVAPPINEVSEHPLFDVNVGPAEITAGAETTPALVTEPAETRPLLVTEAKLAVVPVSGPVREPPARGR